MSYHWENTIWQSKDGSWNRGFFKRISMAGSPNGWEDEDYDSEWDDDFDYSSFDYLQTGFRSLEEAQRWEPGANPGGWAEIPYAGNSKECKLLDQLAHWHRYPEEKAKHERRELLRKNREHFKKLQEVWTPEAIRAAAADHFLKLTATIKGNESAFEIYGSSISATGRLIKKGDWLEIEGKRIYNLKTDKFEKHVHKLERYTAPRFGYGRGW